MFIPDPGSWFLPIPDPGSINCNKREGWKINFCRTFLFSLKCHKIEHYFSFEVLKKKILANFQRIFELFTQKIVTKLSKIWVRDPGSEIWDPGSGKNLFRIPDLGSRGQKGTGSRIQDPDSQQWDPGSRMNIFDHISENLETIFRVKIFKFSYADPNPWSGINIPDPQLWMVKCLCNLLSRTF